LNTPWVSPLFLVPTIVIAICLAGFLLNRFSREKRVSKSLLILALHILIVIFRSKDVFSYINSLFPINHGGWFILILIVFVAFFLTLKLLQESGATFPYRYVDHINIGYIILLSIIFVFVSQTPANIDGRLVYTVSQGLFMALYYIYAVYLSLGLFHMTVDLRRDETNSYQKYRWVAISVIFILYAIYNALALVNIGFVYTIGDKVKLITVTNSIVLLISTFAVIPIFAPGWVYKRLDIVINFYRKIVALYKLLKIKKLLKKESFCAFETIEPDKNTLDQFNINFHLHKSLMFIQDYKYHAIQAQKNEDIRFKFPTTFAVIQVDDEQDGLDLITAYTDCSIINTRYCQV